MNYEIFSFFNLHFLKATACGILVPQPGIESAPPELEVGSLNHWTAWMVPRNFFLNSNLDIPLVFFFFNQKSLFQ